MNALSKWLFLGCAVLAVVVVGGLLVLEPLAAGARLERREQETALKPLLQSHASREQVAQALGLPLQQCVDYSVGSTNRWVVEQRRLDPLVRQQADRFPGVLFHSTENWMTWLFFDADGRFQDYYLATQ